MLFLGSICVAACRRGVARVSATKVAADMKMVVISNALRVKPSLVLFVGAILSTAHFQDVVLSIFILLMILLILVITIGARYVMHVMLPGCRGGYGGAGSRGSMNSVRGSPVRTANGVFHVSLPQKLQVLAFLVVAAVVAAVGAPAPAAGGDERLVPLQLEVIVVLALLKGALAAQVGPGPQLVLQDVLAAVLLAHDEELAVVDVAEVLEFLDGEVVPLHEEDAGHEPVGDEDADAGEVVLAELAPQTLVEAADAVVGVSGAFAVGDAVEEVAVVGTLLPHAFHLGATWLEVTKVLLAKPGLFVYLDIGAAEGRGLVVVRGQRGEDALGGLASAAVGRGEEVQGVVGAEELAEAAACLVSLGPAVGGQFNSVVGRGLVNLAAL